MIKQPVEIKESLLSVRGVDASSISILDDRNTSLPPYPPSFVTQSNGALFLEIKQTGSKSAIDLLISKKYSSTEACTGIDEGNASVTNDSTCTARVRARAYINDLVMPLLPRSEFDAVALASADGEVLLQSGPASIPLLKLALPNGTASDSEGSFDLNMESETANNGSDVFAMNFAGLNYKVFWQRVRLPEGIWRQLNAPDCAEILDECLIREREWVLVAFKDTSTFREEARAIPQNVFIVLSVFAVFLLLSIPYIKFRFLGIRERISSIDILVVITTICIAFSMATLGILGGTSYIALKTSVNDSLAQLAEKIDSSFADERENLDVYLRGLNDAVTEQQQKSNSLTDSLFTNLFANTLLLSSEEKKEFEMSTESARDELYPYVDVVYWIDADGAQRMKMNSKGSSSPLISIPDRTYFIEARNANMWRGNNLENGLKLGTTNVDSTKEPITHPGYTMESIRSKTSGQVYAVMAHRLNTKQEDNSWFQSSVVSAATINVLSLIQPTLPPDFGFCVFRSSDGQVLFHHDTARNGRENLYEEIDAAMEVASVAQSSLTSAFEGQYRGQQHQMFVQPLSGTPWSLMVFSPSQPLKETHASIFTHSLQLFVCYALILLFILFIYYWLRRTKDKQAIKNLFLNQWPSSHYTGNYLFIIIGPAGYSDTMAYLHMSPLSLAPIF